MEMTFQKFPKIPRLSRDMIITEKIDGTNAQVAVFPIEDIPEENYELVCSDGILLAEEKDFFICAGSRNRWLTIDKDNYGFAAWVRKNADELFNLGVGRHYGEWWGKGINRGYDLNERRFSLFNVKRWSEERPECCDVVPVLQRDHFHTLVMEETLAQLSSEGSKAAPGYMHPEGIVIYHVQGGVLFKKTVEKDEEAKGWR